MPEESFVVLDSGEAGVDTSEAPPAAPTRDTVEVDDVKQGESTEVDTEDVCTVESEQNEESCAAELVASKQTCSVQQEKESGQCQWDPLGVLEPEKEHSLALVQMADNGDFEPVKKIQDLCLPDDITKFINEVSPNDKDLRTTILFKNTEGVDVLRYDRGPELPNAPDDLGTRLYIFISSTIVIVIVLATRGYRTYKGLKIQEADAADRRLDAADRKAREDARKAREDDDALARRTREDADALARRTREDRLLAIQEADAADRRTREDRLLAIQEADAEARRAREKEVVDAGVDLVKRSRNMTDFTALVEALNEGVSNSDLEVVDIASKTPE